MSDNTTNKLFGVVVLIVMIVALLTALGDWIDTTFGSTRLVGIFLSGAITIIPFFHRLYAMIMFPSLWRWFAWPYLVIWAIACVSFLLDGYLAWQSFGEVTASVLLVPVLVSILAWLFGFRYVSPAYTQPPVL